LINKSTAYWLLILTMLDRMTEKILPAIAGNNKGSRHSGGTGFAFYGFDLVQTAVDNPVRRRARTAEASKADR
jgi:hypothetical protein